MLLILIRENSLKIEILKIRLFKLTLEAAEEISRQIRIRDLAGLIVIDFIDMLDRNHNFKVEKRLEDFLKLIRARVQVKE